jgi:hypothetical protein
MSFASQVLEARAAMMRGERVNVHAPHDVSAIRLPFAPSRHG